jgi:nucleoside-diphosphate-sugar epimerase
MRAVVLGASGFFGSHVIDTTSRTSRFDDARVRALGYVPQFSIDDAVAEAIASEHELAT